MGTTGHVPGQSNISVALSQDGGTTWTRSSVINQTSSNCVYSTGTVNVLIANGYVWHDFESYCGSLQWPQSFRASVAYAPVDSDLLDPSSWTITRPMPFNNAVYLPAWKPEPVNSGGYVEGNMVQDPSGRILDIIRCRFYNAQQQLYTLEWACAFEVSMPTSSQPAQMTWLGIVNMPGGGNNFQILFDDVSGYYVSLTNPSIDRYGQNPDARNIVTLIYSPDVISWSVAATVLLPNDGLPWNESLDQTGYMYAKMAIDGEDLLTTIRTSLTNATSFQDTDMLTFKRISNFRQYLDGQFSGEYISGGSVPPVPPPFNAGNRTQVITSGGAVQRMGLLLGVFAYCCFLLL